MYMILLYLTFSFYSKPCGMQNSAVEAYWAHNPEVRGSKPRSAIFQSIVQKVSFLLLEKEVPQPGIEPGFLRPQRTVLTTRLLRQLLSFACKTISYIMLSYVKIFCYFFRL